MFAKLYLEPLEERELLSVKDPIGGLITDIQGGISYITAVLPTGGSDSCGAVIRYNPDNGSSQHVTDNHIVGWHRFNKPMGIVNELTHGTNYLTVVDSMSGADGRGAVIRINPTTGSTQLVSDNHVVGWTRFIHPTGITNESWDINYLTVVDPVGGIDGHGAVIRVNPVTGSTQLVSDNRYSGVAFNYPVAITNVQINNNKFLAVVDSLGAVILVDPLVGVKQLLINSTSLTNSTAITSSIIDGKTYLVITQDTAIYKLDTTNNSLSLVSNVGYLTQPAAAIKWDNKSFKILDVGAFHGEGAILSADINTGIQAVSALVDNQGYSFYQYYLNNFGDLFFRTVNNLNVIEKDVSSYSMSAYGTYGKNLSIIKTTGTESSKTLINPADLDLLRSNPSQFITLAAKYDSDIQNLLGTNFSGINTAGKQAVFATIVAYELSGYRSVRDPGSRPLNLTLPELLNTSRLVCSEYNLVVSQLLYTNNINLQIIELGWTGGFVGNHAQLFVIGGGIPLILDPTNGIVANTTFDNLVNSIGTSKVLSISNRIDYDIYDPFLPNIMKTAATKVQNAISQGKYKLSDLIYYIDISTLTSFSSNDANVYRVNTLDATGIIHGALYSLGAYTIPNVINSPEITLPGGLLSLSITPAPDYSRAIYFTVTDINGNIWSIDLNQTSWQ